MEPEYRDKNQIVRPPDNKICPFISTPDNLVECLRERCAAWTINECAAVRLAKGKTSL